MMVVAGAGWVVLGQACITSKTRRQAPACARRRTRRSHDGKTRFLRVHTSAVFILLLASIPKQCFASILGVSCGAEPFSRSLLYLCAAVLSNFVFARTTGVLSIRSNSTCNSPAA